MCVLTVWMLSAAWDPPWWANVIRLQRDTTRSTASAVGSPRRMAVVAVLRVVSHWSLMALPHCGGARRLIAMITEGLVVRGILEQLELPSTAPAITPARAPPEPE